MSQSPLDAFAERLARFAGGQRGIRNPFVIMPVAPECEQAVTRWLRDWAANPTALPSDATVQVVRLPHVLAETNVFQLLIDLGARIDPDTVEETMQGTLAEEMVDVIIDRLEAPGRQSHVVVLLGLGSLYPFARSSELLDELDRRNVKSTVGIPFPGNVVGGKLSFFGEESRAYYPAHRIDERVERGDLP